MSERIFSDLTKNDPSDPGQGPVLGDGQTESFDINLAGFSPPYSVMVNPKGGIGTVTREILALVGDEPVQLVAPAAVALNTPDVQTITARHPRGGDPGTRRTHARPGQR